MKETADQKLFGLAARSGGVVRRDDLLGAGMSSSAIYRRTSSGALEVAGSGLYVVPELRISTTPLWVASLAVPGSVLSQVSAARLHDFPVPDDGFVHVTARKGSGRKVKGVVVHESRLPMAEDLATVAGLVATSPSRTLFDLGARLTPARFRFVLSDVRTDG